eukprot:COSAG01_NODE_20231_length_964_cov_1.728324_3_plen_26_part_01
MGDLDRETSARVWAKSALLCGLLQPI